MKWIDSHAHLDDRAFDNDRAAVIARCAEASMGILAVGSSLQSSRQSIQLAHRHRNMWATVGVHPHNAKTVDAAVLGDLRRMAQDKLVVGIGEIGLDYYRDLSPRGQQRDAFQRQLELAIEMDLPICLHNRESTNDFLSILSGTRASHRGVVHSFLGDGRLAESFMALGLHLGIGGPLTFPKNRALRDAVKHVPLDRILLETDCPYLTPVPYRGRRNEPIYVQYVAEEIARLKGISPDAVAEQAVANTQSLFGMAS